jgi:hypothetical protein
MNELQLTIEEMKLGHMEAKVQQMNPNVPDRDPDDHGYESEYELYDRLIHLGVLSGVANEFIMESLSARQRADFWDRVRVVNAYEHDGMSEREYMAVFKMKAYKRYLNQ